jgi:hypothetical protein
MSHVMLNTIVRNTYLGSKVAHVTCSTSATAKTATATLPATNTSAGSIVFGSVTNYMKIHPWAASGSTPTIRVIGWSLCSDTRLWIPHSIAEVQMASLTGTNVSILGSNQQAAATLTKGAGDAKLFAPSTTATDAYFVVDAQGFELVELHFRVASGTVLANAHIGDM